MAIAWYGTGLMGAGFVEALCKRGEDVVVSNRTFEKARALERFGARAVEDPREAVRGASRVHVMIGDDAAVDAYLERIADALAPGALVVDHTTVAPHPTAARFQRMAARGIAFLHAPVFMSPQHARDAAGIMLASGPAATFERAKPFLEAMTGELWYLGERADKAAALKLVGNQMLFFIVAGLADAFALGSDAGLTPHETFELFEHFKPGGTIDFRGKLMANADFRAFFELTMARKDARLMLETAAHGDVPLQFLPAIAARMDALIAAGHGADDVSVLGIDGVRGASTAGAGPA
jgi:3-hydroxyisobutyrate dehydrogenase